MAILTEGSWQTPLGEAMIDAALASELARLCPHLREDAAAHELEHSLEVQIPFLQLLAREFSFVPVVLGVDRYALLEELGHAMARAVAGQAAPVLLIASSDMNHYESEAITRAKDQSAIDRILELDPKGLYNTVRKKEISMCGYVAAVAMLVAVLDLGAKKAHLVRHATSGDTTGDRNEVVGYAGITVE
jgi:hypothetical protein